MGASGSCPLPDIEDEDDDEDEQLKADG